VICARTESRKRVGNSGAGWLHRLRDDGWRDRPRQRRVKVETPREPAIECWRLAGEWYGALGKCQRGYIARDLGVTVDALEFMRVGWSAKHRATTWPMRGGDGHICGIRFRRDDGIKFSVRGGRNGIFVGQLPDGPAFPGVLIIVEGATDTAAMLSIGIEACGRPSCSGGSDAIIKFCSPDRWERVAIVADADEPGQRGARSLAARLVGYVPDGVRIVTPPTKDVRDWVRQGATRDDVLAAIDAAPVMTLTYGRVG
jgi:hypothetical protein